MSLVFRSAVVMGALLLALTCPLAAQRVAGPFSGVLGGDRDARNSLDFRSSLFGAWDVFPSTDDTVGEGDLPVRQEDRFLRGGFSLGGNVGLSHARRTDGLDWQSDGSSAFRFYGPEGGGLAATLGGQSSISTSLSTRTSMSASAGVAYSPFYQVSPQMTALPGTASNLVDPFTLAAADTRNVGLHAEGGVTYRLSRKDSISAGVGGQWNEFLDDETATTSSWNVSARYQRDLTSKLGVYGGMTRSVADYNYLDAPEASSTSIDAGVRYGDTLTFSRRMSMSFSTSTSVIHWEDDTHFHVGGSVDLTRQIGRTGSASVSYLRNAEYQPGFRAPVLSDNLSATFGSQLGRQASWSVYGGLTRGGVGFGNSDYGAYHSGYAGANINRALTRQLSAFVAYSYARYDVPIGSTTFLYDTSSSRQSVYGGINFYLPLIQERGSR